MSDAPLDPPVDYPVDDLLDVLDLRREGSTTIRVASPEGMGEDLADSHGDVFVGRSQPMPHGRVFGGQVLAQCLIAAGRTVEPVEDGSDPEPLPRPIHSMHGYFLRPGDANRPLRFLVERMRDGRSFSARRVHAVQDGRILMSIIMSFQEAAGGLEHQLAMPQVVGPEELRSDREILEQVEHPVAQKTARQRPVELRHVEPLLLGPGEPGPSEQAVWMRISRPLPDDPLLHAAILAYASDYVLLEPVLRRHGIGWGDPRLRPASLDHSMWFHRPARVDEWVLYTQSSPSASSGRGLGTGHMFAADGTLLATVGQEGMVRLRSSEEPS
ncbi:Acyl-CoA thioesterase II [Serinicoccus hydrothermalis]|uniref:Acyl-CoA thioesterase 2 n=1 Tax=Serinicoccus hydrothermalis TaxID=1758689 RepID=A0A1B1NAS5_9MICO|nr:acyl-CoA thioesterase II [Serinicoccus hydrothermalis]ANS78540.1 Acyl-CoA thioesterase II [Serinicoccus hydrothermalis]